MAAVAGVDIYQSPYTPADLLIMSEEIETLEWDRTCRIVEMVYNTQVEKPMRFNEYHPFRKTQPRSAQGGVKKVKSSEFRNKLKGVGHVNRSGVSSSIT